MTTTYQGVILHSLLSSLSTGLGVALALLLRENPRAIAAGVGFSAGMMAESRSNGSSATRTGSWNERRASGWPSGWWTRKWTWCC
jgi:hypothetical protein